MNTDATIRPQSPLANCIRALSMDAVEKANSGHPGAPMGMADAATVLYEKHLKFDASAPDWPDRDRVVLSNGHASMMLYSLLYLTGYEDMTIDEIRNFRQWGSRTAGHPEYGMAKGIETTTGPLGQGLGAAVGMAMAEKIMAGEFGDEVVDHRTYCFCGDGCLMEGVGQEAVSLAGHLKLDKLTVLYDDNSISIDGATSLSFSDDIPAKFRALGWHVVSCNGQVPEEVDAALKEAKAETGRPTLIDMKTIIGYGAPDKQGTAKVHGSALGADEIAAARKALGWTAEPFVIPDDLLERWRAIGRRGADQRRAWEDRLAGLAPEKRAEFERRIEGRLPADFDSVVGKARDALIDDPQKLATRKSSQNALEVLTAAVPEMIGGSADLTGSNNTDTKSTVPSFTPDHPGRYVHYGVREFAMAAVMNGMSNHGGVIPYGGTFLTFSDYCRNGIRIAALMHARTIFVMTHDSIGLGEDGPTHQPVEHMAALRAIPNLNVFRPADTVEALECWALAVKSDSRPSVLALSRQGVPQLRTEKSKENRCARGAYVIRTVGEGERDLTILATGTEVSMAVTAAEQLGREGFTVAVVSMPSWELFEAETKSYRDEVLGSAPRLAIEAASKFGWTRYVDSEDDVIGLDTFGHSAPGDIVYREMGITAEALAERARTRLNV